MGINDPNVHDHGGLGGAPIVLGAAPGVVTQVLELGATIHRIDVSDRSGERRNVVLGYSLAADYLAGTAYLGATVGRYANRIAGAEFSLDGVVHQLAGNDRGNNLHGGPEGFDRQRWTLIARDDARVALRLVSPDGDQGFPGTLTADVIFTAGESWLRIDYTASTDAPTLANLSSHVYWNLDGEGASTVDEHVLTIPADQYTPIDATGIPIGGHVFVDQTPFDFRTAKKLGPAIGSAHQQIRLAGGIDHNFVVLGVGLRDVAVLESPASGVRMTLRSDRPGLQVYTGNALGGSSQGPSGHPYGRGAGIALEPQFFPDSPHQLAWPSTVLRPGETYRSVTEMRFQAV